MHIGGRCQQPIGEGIFLAQRFFIFIFQILLFKVLQTVVHMSVLFSPTDLPRASPDPRHLPLSLRPPRHLLAVLICVHRVPGVTSYPNPPPPSRCSLTVRWMLLCPYVCSTACNVLYYPQMSEIREKGFSHF